MEHELTERFIAALERAERTGVIDDLVALCDQGTELCNQAHSRPERGPAGARRFWREYLHAFDAVRSRFTRVREAETLSVLEWRAQGDKRGGGPIAYRGVTVLEHDGETLRRVSTWYDSAALIVEHLGPKHGPPGAPHAPQ